MRWLLFGAGDVDHPRGAELVGEHAETVAPGGLVERIDDGAAIGELVPIPRSSASSSPLSDTVMVLPGLNSICAGVSEPIST
jgi:hypothetical protein